MPGLRDELRPLRRVRYCPHDETEVRRGFGTVVVTSVAAGHRRLKSVTGAVGWVDLALAWWKVAASSGGERGRPGPVSLHVRLAVERPVFTVQLGDEHAVLPASRHSVTGVVRGVRAGSAAADQDVRLAR